MPLWLCNSLVLTSVTKLKKRNEIICHEISLKKPIFNWEFSFQQPIFLRVKICRCLLSWGCYDPSIFFFLLRFPRLQETEKKTRNRILDLNHKKGGLVKLNPWVGKFGFLVVFGWGPGGQERWSGFSRWYGDTRVSDNNNGSGSLVLQPSQT